MNQIMRAFLSGATGVFVAEFAEPYIAKIVPQTSALTVKATKAVSAGAGTAVAWWALGALGVKG